MIDVYVMVVSNKVNTTYYTIKGVVCKYDGYKDGKMDSGMERFREEQDEKEKETISCQDLRKQLIEQTIEENRVTLERLSRT